MSSPTVQATKLPATRGNKIHSGNFSSQNAAMRITSVCLGSQTYHKAEVLPHSSHSSCIMQAYPEQLYRAAFPIPGSRPAMSTSPFHSTGHSNPVLFAAFSQDSELGHPVLIYHHSFSPASLQGCLWLLLEGERKERHILFCVKKKKPTALQFPSSVKCPDRIPNVFQLPVSHLNAFQRGQAVPEEKKSK